MRGVEFVKGHGTENDFVVLPDPEGVLDLTDRRVRALCDRRRGLGADGVLRVVRASHVDDAPSDVDPSCWFMDYRNADGSAVEMCGNGVRVFATYLVSAGLAEPGEVVVGTRSGPRPTRVRADGVVTVGMGPARVTGGSTASLGGTSFPGFVVDVGNPHLACLTDFPVAEFDLSDQPSYDTSVFPRGVNVELVNALDARTLRMRVHERGVGETRSCGTGTVAAVAAALHASGEHTGRRTVHVPGGTLEVEITEDGSTLTGPAVLVARGELDADWWAAADR
ncbi:diaminopimelate epimerase [Streptoalloteichus tenebrarius]|uniref:Diaminopimelate epimerase n=1 Tax=Streptoalloteichus tenebrarius (strain ATCC 17920 / DSM 40477 / JCM 4838 / CBS 697.72 / NBRC 16177 / NCIMB 11028 / NRRL B-12390 / A12253. 1 / ISP 5477) TaxID=1933 RepID=A0ABT1HMP5_STRSD|nr:diaminopimelate epimerase [Streptoalloteichus tenebrarius]MCP2256785.1 diaminopimelate epimerase [Streptoalloteichus tenebrarius]BFF00310.1 diaminopimelate epimerase [Streptoalloteichus tenebrarius]